MQGYLNSHPAIGDRKLLKTLGDSMHLACSKQSMETWSSHHAAITTEPDIGDYEDFLLEQLAAKPSIGSKAMCTAIKKNKGVTFKEAPIRTWLAAHTGALPMPTAEAASSSSAVSMAMLDISGLEPYADFLRQQLSEEHDITAVLLRDKLIQAHGVSCLEQTMQRWLERARSSVPKRAIKRGSSDLPTLENLEAHGDYLRGLLAEDLTISFWKLREAMKTKGFLVSEQTMRTWLDRYHGKWQRVIIAPLSKACHV